jgi:hypothetical protein
MDRTTVLQQLAKLIFTFKPLWEDCLALLDAMALKKPISSIEYHWQKDVVIPANRFYLLKYKNLILILSIKDAKTE